jgi:hypothetical protein
MDDPTQIQATDGTQASPSTNATRSSGESRAFAFGIAAWLLPGLGHALQKMWGRALVVFFAVGLLVFAGASMKGNVFTREGTDAFDKLGYIADLGTGSFYLFARAIETKGADVSHAGGDYGTRLLATAGVLNLLAALHAYEAARGHKA